MPTPTFKPTRKLKKKAEVLIGVGMSEDQIAIVFGISTTTLRKYFADQLLHGRARAIAENTARLTKAADAGNVTAQKYLDGKFTGTTKTEPYVSKKIEQYQASKTAGHGSEWGDDLTPPPEAVN